MKNHQQHHYFASCVSGWAIADTRHEAILKLVNYYRSELKLVTKNQHKNGEPGAYLWSVRVMEPSSTKYEIEYFAPKGVKTENGREHFATYITSKEIKYWTPGEEDHESDDMIDKAEVA